MNFAELFKDTKRPAEDGRCEYSKPPNTETLDLEEGDVDKVKDLWEFCLLGCFARRFPRLKAIHNLVDTWNTKCTVRSHFNGWVVFQFESLEEMERVLVEGPYFVFGRTLLLRSIPENLCFRDEDYSVVPVWVHLQSLPLQCWNTRVIRKIASKVGKPICVDNFTMQRKRISYARVLVEIDTSVAPNDSFEVRLPCGTVYTQYINFKNLPKFCKHCYYFGHYIGNCKHLHKQGETEQPIVHGEKKDDDNNKDYSAEHQSSTPKTLDSNALSPKNRDVPLSKN